VEKTEYFLEVQAVRQASTTPLAIKRLMEHILESSTGINILLEMKLWGTGDQG
jgi:hypothetical protein